jgi:S-formylglutathione hydrolase FrmB
MKKPYRLKTISSFFCLLILALIPFSAYAQPAKSGDSARVFDLKLKSDLMNRDMPYRVILPVGYRASDKEKSYPTIYLLHGLTGHYDNWGDLAKLEKHTVDYQYIFVMPEGNNGWYTDSDNVENDKYESYIVDELIPSIEKNYQARATREGRVIAGLSMGGYGSLKFGLKYPQKFVLSGSFSGALRAAEWDDKTLPSWKVLSDSVMTTFGPKDSNTRKENNIFEVLKSKSKEEIGKLPFFYIDCGTEDGLIIQNQEFAGLLLKQKVPHEFRQLPGKHDWVFWEAQIQEFLELTRKYVK